MVGLGLALWLHYLERKEATVENVKQLKLESIETQCNELNNQTKDVGQLRQSLLNKKERLTHLREALRGASYTLSEEDLSQMLVNRALSLVEKGESASLYFLKKDREQLLQMAQTKWSPETPAVSGENLTLFHQWVLRNRQPLLVEDVKKEFRFEIPQAFTQNKNFPKGLISIPLISEDKMLGLLTLTASKEESLSVEELRLLTILSSFYALSLSNARLYRETERLANLDGLTQLVVKRCFRESLSQELYQGKQTKRVVSLLMLDIDFFKKVNDEHGHLVGDAVLVKISEILRKFSPQNAVVCRYGGEEFSILLPGFSKKEAFELAEKFRSEVEQMHLLIRRQQIKVTLSAGVACFPEDALVEEPLLKGADSALYQAKREGRNRVVGV